MGISQGLSRAVLLELGAEPEHPTLYLTTLELLAIMPGNRTRVTEFEPTPAGDRS
jgi:hypothetical protein